MMLLAPALFFLAVALVNVFFWPGVRRRETLKTVSILIPARNEEANLPECLEAAVATDALEIIVYNDHSTDATARIVRSFASKDSRVRLLDPSALPLGWAGKTFACHCLSLVAQGDYLLFLDADVRITADGPNRIAAEAEDRGASLLSCWPGFEMRSFWERALMPLLNFVVFSIYPSPLSFYLPHASLGLAHGACILARRDVYRRLGGHVLVRNEMFEDTRLAQVWRELGERGLCLDGAELVTVRMYQNFSEIWRGFQKNFYPAFRHKRNYWSFLALHFFVFLLPFFLLPFDVDLWPAAVVILCIRLVLALRFHHPLWSVLLQPFAETLLIALGLISFWRVIKGRGVTWKGRAYRTT